jgi:hypothetical protein
MMVPLATPLAFAVKVASWIVVEWIVAVTDSPGLNPGPWIIVNCPATTVKNPGSGVVVVVVVELVVVVVELVLEVVVLVVVVVPPENEIAVWAWAPLWSPNEITHESPALT